MYVHTVARRYPTHELLLFVLTVVALSSCTSRMRNENASDSAVARTSNTATASDSINYPVTLEVLDAFLADSSFDSLAKEKVGLTDAELLKIRTNARHEAARLEKAQMTNGEYSGSTADAKARALAVVDSIVGPDKRSRLFALVEQQWSGRSVTASGMAPPDSNSVEGTRNAVPNDSRVVVNIPAYRMDVFNNGNLEKSYEVAIGYPEFPLPTGLREAQEIIFNPTWTPPDESWVEGPDSKVKVGEKVAAGAKLNPLGVLKIPIGEPSLIHGGKSPAKLGAFGSHGCVGLVDPDALDFAERLAQLSGKPLTDSAVSIYVKDKKTTHDIRLPKAVPVELRYETIVAQNGELHIYRDVYERNTNTQENLDATLKTYGLSMKNLTQDEQSKVLAALHDMSKDITTNTDTNIVRDMALKDSSSSKERTKKGRKSDHRPKVTRHIKGEKEEVIPITALRGRGYPQPVGMNEPLANNSKSVKQK